MFRSERKISKSFSVPALLLAAALLPCGRAYALDRGGYTMEILIGGTPLREYAARGTNYIEALKGREYSVRLCNRTGERVAIALSVDGLSSIDARTTSAVEARKWVLDPYETITLDGWQTTSNTARRFFFTTEEQSYGEWLGRTKNLGLVAAAVFREKRRPPVFLQREGRRDWPGPQSKDAGDSAALSPETAPQGSVGDAPEASPQGSAGAMPEKRFRPAPLGDLAATGIGQETSHPVHQVYFDTEDTPSALLEIRYEYRDTLVRLGVLPQDDLCTDPLMRREGARGFEEPGFAPDPYRRRDR